MTGMRYLGCGRCCARTPPPPCNQRPSPEMRRHSHYRRAAGTEVRVLAASRGRKGGGDFAARNSGARRTITWLVLRKGQRREMVTSCSSSETRRCVRAFGRVRPDVIVATTRVGGRVINRVRDDGKGTRAACASPRTVRCGMRDTMQCAATTASEIMPMVGRLRALSARDEEAVAPHHGACHMCFRGG